MSRIKIIPIDWIPSSSVLAPVDAQLFGAAQAFCEEQFGERKNLGAFTKVWVALEESEDGIAGPVCGIGGIVTRLDVPLFHVSGPHAKRIWAELYERLRNYVEDNGGKGYPAFIYTDPVHLQDGDPHREIVQRFLEKIGAKPAHRFVVEI